MRFSRKGGIFKFHKFDSFVSSSSDGDIVYQFSRNLVLDKINLLGRYIERSTTFIYLLYLFIIITFFNMVEY